MSLRIIVIRPLSFGIESIIGRPRRRSVTTLPAFQAGRHAAQQTGGSAGAADRSHPRVRFSGNLPRSAKVHRIAAEIAV
jgi:hypothetical protein